MNFNDLGGKQTKILFERIQKTEKTISLLLETLTNINNYCIKHYQKTDILAKIIKNISDNEKHNVSVLKALDNTSIALSSIADFEAAKVERIQKNIIPELANYRSICQNTREEIKNQIVLRDREIAKRQHITKSRKKTKKEMVLSNIQIIKILKETTSITFEFETHKVADLKEILKNMFLIQLKYHVACIEIYSNVSKEIADIDEKSDVKDTSESEDNQSDDSERNDEEPAKQNVQQFFQ